MKLLSRGLGIYRPHWDSVDHEAAGGLTMRKISGFILGLWMVVVLPPLIFGGCNNAEVSPPMAEVMVERETTAPDGTVTKTTKRVHTTGPGFKGESAKDLQMGDVWVGHGDMEAGAGGISYQGFDITANLGTRPLYIMGGVAILAGVIVGWLAGWGLGAAIAGAGVGLIATARLFDAYPWVALVPVGMGVIAGLIALYSLWRGKRARNLNQHIVESVEAMTPDTAAAVKQSIKPQNKKQAQKVKSEVQRVKREAGLA